MNQTLDIASRILASLVIARPTGNPQTQAQDALSRASILIEEARDRGIDITDPDAPRIEVVEQAPFIPSNVDPQTDRKLSFGAKRKS